ncbi:hypothetical protein HF078_10535 [Bacillus sp. RO2]|uniref:hypothetical protein n=1 Tax=Bacillus sp. RO2 TaxID=2723913 RepID=UPI00145CA66F|nr:hypothetical protein [Bacillus sp. RO2]NMH73512.1 hypothetical protein [Bacillus sp. RO2]
MEVFGTILFALAAFLLFNFLFALLYILSRSVGNGFYRWITHDLDFLITMSFPLIGLTQWAASSLYERFNWFVARVLIILYSVLIFIMAIVCFYMFGAVEDWW